MLNISSQANAAAAAAESESEQPSTCGTSTQALRATHFSNPSTTHEMSKSHPASAVAWGLEADLALHEWEKAQEQRQLSASWHPGAKSKIQGAAAKVYYMCRKSGA